MTTICFDFETYRFGTRNLAPKPVCVSYSDGESSGVIASCDSAFDDLLEAVLNADQIVNTNIAFDAAVMIAHRPQFTTALFDAYRDDRVTDITIRGKLIALADTGDLNYAYAPNGAKQKILWSQAAMEQRLLGIDRTADKEDDDAWRSNYSALDGMLAEDYPKEAYDYAEADAVNCWKIWELQEQWQEAFGAQYLNARAALALYLNSCNGWPIDSEMVGEMIEEFSKKFHHSNFKRLVKLGILRPATPEMPIKNQLNRAIAELGFEPEEDEGWLEHKERLVASGVRFKQAKNSSINESLLRELVGTVCKTHEIEPVLTDGSTEDNPVVSLGEEMQVEIAGLDKTFDEYIERQKIRSLVTTQLPRMGMEGHVHPKYDILKETSRTSSFGNSKKDKDPAYPAVNIQNQDPRVRECFIAPEGWLICSIDYNFLELVSAANKCIKLFGESALGDAINAGKDPHALLGSRLARKFANFQGDYDAFLEKKKTDPEWYDHWRTMAKPPGLGYPGGLGAKAFVSYAKKTYGVDLVDIAGSRDAAIELAKELKDEWFETFPEFTAFFQWINRDCIDIDWSDPDDKAYMYASAHGTIRRNCTFCSAANGASLQTDSAEGAKIALFNLASVFYDPSLNSPLLGCRQGAFVHDEVDFFLPDDEWAHERAYEAEAIMVESMQQVMEHVKVGAEPALMYRWNKKAKPRFKEGRLIPWTPK